MLTESFFVATETVRAPSAHLSSALKDVGVFHHELQPQPILRQGYKKSSASRNCLAISNTHIFAAQADKAIVNVYSRSKGNQEAAVPFPCRITSVAYHEKAALLVLGFQDGRLSLWEVATGRISTSSASHIEPVTQIEITVDGFIISASSDSSIHIWSMPTLLSFSPDGRHQNDTNSAKSPLRTFTQHRSAITCFAVGSSARITNNFIVSASEDRSCFVWDAERMSILRTILLVEVPYCLVIDPIDRATYLGSKDGSIQCIILNNVTGSKSSILSTSSRGAAIPVQLGLEDQWSTLNKDDLGAANTIALSNDGMMLLTGHENGDIVCWDVAKHRVAFEISDLSRQSVTSIQMEAPVGHVDYSRTPAANVVVEAVVKPKLELSTTSEMDGAAGSNIPAEYVLFAGVSSGAETSKAERFSRFPEDALNDALYALSKNGIASAHLNGDTSARTDTSSTYKVDQLEDEVAVLKTQLAHHQKLEEKRQQQELERMKRREAIGLQKRKAYFAAKRAGQDGDAAMRPFTLVEQEIDNDADIHVDDAPNKTTSNDTMVG